MEKRDLSKGLPEGLLIRTILNNSYDTIYFKDLDSRFIFNSRAHAMQFGVSDPVEMLGKCDRDYFPEVFYRATLADEQEIIRTGRPLIGRVERWDHEDGSVSWLMASKYPLLDEDGAVIGTWGTSRDITALKEAEAQLERLNRQLQEANERLEVLSTRDSLSGLYNHRHFYETLKTAEAQEARQNSMPGKTTFSIALLDIDRFKEINDTYGHQAGDIVIRRVGELLSEVTRVTDTCFRYGGDEFAMILGCADLQAARLVADKIRRVLRESVIALGGESVRITASIGVASYSEAGSVSELINLADERLYRSKAEGRDRVT